MTDNLDLDKIKEETEIDNSRLEELLQKFRDDPSPETVNELGEEIKKPRNFCLRGERFLLD